MSQTRSWFEIKPVNAAAGATRIDLYGRIGGYGVTAGMFLDALATVKTKAIDLHINSEGGDVADGVGIYTALKDHPATVNAVCDGLCASIASVIMQAGDSRKASAGSLLMIHEPMIGIDAIVRGNAADMRDLAAEAEKQAVILDKITENMAEIYAARGGGEESVWRGLMAAETWFRPREAVTAGLIDAVIPAKGANNALTAFNLAEMGFKNVPEWVEKALNPASRQHTAPPDAIAVVRGMNIPVAAKRAAIAHLRAHIVVAA